MISVTTPLGLTRAFTCNVTPVLCEEMRLVTVLDPATVVEDEVCTGTCVPTLMVAGMLSVAIRLGSERIVVRPCSPTD